MSRLPLSRPEDLDADRRAVYDTITGGPRGGGIAHPDGSLRGPFNAMLLSPAVGGALQGVGAAVRYAGILGDRARELAILAVANHWESAFERESHERIGRAVGLTDDDLAAVRTGGVPPTAEAGELLVLQTARTLLTIGDLADEAYADAVDALGEQGLFELTTLVGYYGLLALQMRVFRV